MPVPFISVQTESENAYFDGLTVRQEDSDEENLKYRIYEIAGATHDTKFSLLDYYAEDQDMERTGCKPGYDRFLDDYPNDSFQIYALRMALYVQTGHACL